MPPSLETISTGPAEARSTTMPRYNSRAMSQPSSTSTWRTIWPSGPVWMVTSWLPSRLVATWRASSALLTSCTPCCSGFSLIVPLPRPPAWIWAFTTAIGEPSCVECRGGFVPSAGHDALGHSHSGLAKDLLRLEFVNLHAFSFDPRLGWEGLGAQRSPPATQVKRAIIEAGEREGQATDRFLTAQGGGSIVGFDGHLTFA